MRKPPPTYREHLRSIRSNVERFVVFGPDPIDVREPPGWLETLLPWTVRLFLTVATVVLTLVWSDAPPAPQLSWGLAYSGALAVSLAGSNWGLVGVITCGLGGLWLALALVDPPDRREDPLTWFLQQLVEFLNRQVSHIEAFWIWMAVALTIGPRLHFQLPALAVLILLGGSLVNGLTARRHPEARKSTGDLQALRRPTIYGLTMLGLTCVVLRSFDAQIQDLLPLAAVISLGAAIRGLRHRVRRLRVARETIDGQARVQQFRQAQRQLTREADVGLGPVLAVVGLVGLMALSVLGRRHIEAPAQSAQDGPPPPADACVPELGGPIAPQVTLFLGADSHAHELGGRRFPGQTELADALVSSALRPVEQDMLSAATVRHFGHVFTDMISKAAGPVFWAHLGDLADFSCQGELDRAFQSFATFPAQRLAGIASGNHDVAFTGNFWWSPFWSGACAPTGRMAKATSLAKLRTYLEATAAQRKGTQVALVTSSWLPSWLGGRDGAVMTVTPLGTVVDRRRSRGLAAVFLDSTDGHATNWGIAGVYGSFSAAQDHRLREMVAALPRIAGPAYADPIWLVFSHHPVDDMASPSSQRRLKAFLAWLDRHPAPLPAADGERWPGSAQPRTLAYISAHTHVAESHRHCVGEGGTRRLVREIVIGSMIDPPQQAAVLEVGPNAKGIIAARVRTLPSIGRPGFTCGDHDATLTSAACRQVIAELKQAPACESLFAEPSTPGPDCSSLERPMSTSERLRALLGVRGVVEPDDILSEQVTRGGKLLACLCRPGAPGAEGGACRALASGADPFRREARADGTFTEAWYAAAVRERLEADGPAGGRSDRELTCLAWAAAAVEGHKASAMTMPTALRCAFDDTTLPAAQETVAALEVQACR